MEIVLLTLDFLCPVFFFFLGRAHRSAAVRRIVVRESFLTFSVALLFAPTAFLLTPLAVQGMLCAAIFLTQTSLLTKSLFLVEKKK